MTSGMAHVRDQVMLGEPDARQFAKKGVHVMTMGHFFRGMQRCDWKRQAHQARNEFRVSFCALDKRTLYCLIFHASNRAHERGHARRVVTTQLYVCRHKVTSVASVVELKDMGIEQSKARRGRKGNGISTLHQHQHRPALCTSSRRPTAEALTRRVVKLSLIHI